MFTGCGALAIAEALPANGVVVTCEWDLFMVEMARDLLDQSQHGKKVVIKPGICHYFTFYKHDTYSPFHKVKGPMFCILQKKILYV